VVLAPRLDHPATSARDGILPCSSARPVDLGLGYVYASSIERWFSSMGRPARYDLGRSGAPARSVADLLNLGSQGDFEEYLSMSLDYGDGAGSDRLRHAIATAVGATAAEVVVTHGAVEALLLACAAAVGERKDVAVASPAYEGLIRAVQAAGGRAHRCTVWTPGSKRLDLAPIANLDLARYAAVIVNSPHNPTGLRVDGSELQALVQRCEASSTTLVVDEVSYATLDSGASSVVQSTDPGDSALIAVGDVSKSFGVGGLRVGWCVTRCRRSRARIAELRDLTSLANSTPGQLLAALALENRQHLSVAPVARHNLERLERWMASTPGTRWVAPVDGLVAFCGLPLESPSSAFAARVRVDHDVSVTPGSFFGHDFHLRLGLGLREVDFAEGLDRLSQAIREDEP
jgi:aspartate/methionine/tyrosine aminotransferase